MGMNTYKPNCVVNQEKSTMGKLVITCQPRDKVGKRVFGSQRPMVFVKDEGESPVMIDDGGANAELIRKTTNHVKKY